MNHTIQNEFLTVTAAEHGAELQSILGSDGTEYLWQGDSAYWSNRALNIFPYVARLTQGSYYLDGQLYHMDIHGLAPYRTFTLKKMSAHSMVLELVSDDDTYVHYPRQFAFRVIYTLCDNALEVTYEVENRDSRTMYFGLGGHPGFQIPLVKGLGFSDYHLRFDAPCTPKRVGFSEDCFVTGQDVPYPLADEQLIPLRHDLFDNDAIVLRDMSRQVTLEAPGDRHAVTVSYPGMQYLGIWHWPKTDAPYVCIEPWCSLPAVQDNITVLEEQKDLISLAPHGTYTNTWKITVR